jgi:hypothetical protein
MLVPPARLYGYYRPGTSPAERDACNRLSINCWVKLFRSALQAPPRSRAGSPGRLPALAPTDPDLPHLGIRLVRSRIRDAQGVPDPAIRWRFVNTVPGFEAPAVWPSNGSATRRLLPWVGFPLVEFPDFVGIMRRSDSLASVSRRFFCIRFAIPRPAPVVCSRRSSTRNRRAWGW